MRRTFPAVLFLIFSSNALAAWNENFSPWAAPKSEYSDWTQPEARRRREAWERLAQRHTPEPDVLWLPSLIGSDMLWAYQHSLSGNTGSSCLFYPSCSRYSRIAVESYGLTLGVLMTAERFSRCHAHANKANQYPLKEISGNLMIWNPPVLDAWWKGNTP